MAELICDMDFVGHNPTTEEGSRILDRHWWRKPDGEWRSLPPCTTEEALAASCIIGPIEIWPAIIMPCRVTNRDTVTVRDGDPPDGSRLIAILERKPIDIGATPYVRTKGGES